MQDSEHEEGNNSEDEDNACEECKKEQFFDFVFEAEEFLDSEYKEMMEEVVEDRKNDYKDCGYSANGGGSTNFSILFLRQRSS